MLLGFGELELLVFFNFLFLASASVLFIANLNFVLFFHILTTSLED
jgi:hypothetical protein